MSDKDKEKVLKMAKDNDVKFIRLWFTDILGFLKGFAITIDELEVALDEGMGFDGSSIQGYLNALHHRWIRQAAHASHAAREA